METSFPEFFESIDEALQSRNFFVDAFNNIKITSIIKAMERSGTDTNLHAIFSDARLWIVNRRALKAVTRDFYRRGDG